MVGHGRRGTLVLRQEDSRGDGGGMTAQRGGQQSTIVHGEIVERGPDGERVKKKRIVEMCAE